jgi:hypothetical protein
MKSGLSVGQRRLLEMMQQLNFGRIENLVVRAGEPTFEPPPKIVQEIKIGGENGPRPELARDNFALKNQIGELFEHLDRIGHGIVALIEVKHGLPFRLVVEQPV